MMDGIYNNFNDIMEGMKRTTVPTKQSIWRTFNSDKYPLSLGAYNNVSGFAFF